MANSSGVPGSTTNGDSAKPYVEPKEENPRDWIEGFGTPTWPSSEKKILNIPEQQKKSGC
jgi:hypothetical protein